MGGTLHKMKHDHRPELIPSLGEGAGDIDTYCLLVLSMQRLRSAGWGGKRRVIKRYCNGSTAYTPCSVLLLQS